VKRMRRLDSHRRLDTWISVVAYDFEILETVVVDAVRATLDVQLRELSWGTRQLRGNLLFVIGVRVGITQADDDLVGDQIALLCQHVGQERECGDVVRQTETKIDPVPKIAIGFIALLLRFNTIHPMIFQVTRCYISRY